MDHLIIIDGYNVIHRTPQLKPGSDRTLRESREKLVNLLSWMMGGNDSRFIVVFDGTESMSRDDSTGRVQVRYSQLPDKADDVIRRMVEDEIERMDRVTVVTADLEVARHARAMGADISLSDIFLASALGMGKDTDSDKPAELEKPAQLTKAEIEQWAELFRSRPRAAPEGEDLH